MQLAKLKLVSAVRRRKTVADIRRDKLLGKLDEQIGLATAQVEGKTFEARRAKCVFRRSVTARFGIVTAEFGSVTDRFGDVTDGRLVVA